MPILLGFLLVLIAGFFQGSFVLPMTLTKRWKWEHTWAAFSLFGMLVFNWILTDAAQAVPGGTLQRGKLVPKVQVTHLTILALFLFLFI